MPASPRNVVFVDGIRTPFGKAGDKGIYAQTRADDLVVACIRELLGRHPELPPARVDEVAVAATTQIGDQGLTIGRMSALLSGLPVSVPGYAIDRMCAGAMTAVTTGASGIGFGAYDVVIAGGVEHMGRHPMGRGGRPQPADRRRATGRHLGAGDGRRPPRTCTTATPTSPRTGQTATRWPARPRSRPPTRQAGSSRTWCRWRSGTPTLAGGWPRSTSRRRPRPRWPIWPRCGPRSGPTAGSPRATPPASTTAPTACLLAGADTAAELDSRCGCVWSATPSPASTRR